MDSELLLKVFIFSILGTGQGMGLPNLVEGVWGLFLHLLSQRDSEPVILLSFRNLKQEKRKKKTRATKT